MYRTYESHQYIYILDDFDRTTITICFGPQGEIKTKEQAQVLSNAIIKLLPPTSAQNKHIAARAAFRAACDASREAYDVAALRQREVERAYHELCKATPEGQEV